MAGDNQHDTISVHELKSLMDKNESPLILDVRQPAEYEICNIGGVLIPLGELSGRVNELDTDKDIVVMCHSGSRSFVAMRYLQRLGFKNVRNLSGGIDEWAVRIDPKMRRY